MVSTRRILAVMLGRLRMSVEECEAAYLSMSERIFNPRRGAANFVGRAHDAWNLEGRFDSNELKASVLEILAEHGFWSEELLQDPYSKCKVFVCAVLTSNTTACVLRSYRNDDLVELLYDSCTIWEACRATSAATSFFDPIAIGPYDQKFADGAIMYNNPIQLVHREAETLWPDRAHDATLLSLGTGSAPSPALEGNIVKVAQALKDIVVQTESTADDFFSDHKRMADNGQLYRFGVCHGLGEIGLEEYKEKRRIADATHAYLTNGETRQRWRRCIQTLGDEGMSRASPVVAANMSRPLRPHEKGSPPVSPAIPDLALKHASQPSSALVPIVHTQTPSTSSAQVTPAVHASTADTTKVLEASVEYVQDANLKLIHAVRMINLPEVYEALRSGANVNSNKNKPLATAVATGETDVVSALIQNGAEVNQLDGNENTPLITDVENQNFSTAKYLLESGADVNTRNRQGYTPLHVACNIGNQPLVKLLLDYGANPLVQNASTDTDGTKGWQTAIHTAAVNNHPGVIQILLEAGVDIEIQNSFSWTPFMLACTNGSLEAAKILGARGAKVDATDSSDPWTSLHSACYSGHEEIVKLLIDAGADIEARMKINGSLDWTPLTITAYSKQHEPAGRIAAFLLSKGADPTGGSTVCTPMVQARRYNNTPVFNALKAHEKAQKSLQSTPEKVSKRSFVRRMLS
ncbi:MAG: hypothetical protein Q9160_008919 [Pyrenula sp. 1 TL-2023]